MDAVLCRAVYAPAGLGYDGPYGADVHDPPVLLLLHVCGKSTKYTDRRHQIDLHHAVDLAIRYIFYAIDIVYARIIDNDIKYGVFVGFYVSLDGSRVA